MANEDQQFCLRWNNFPNNFASQFDALRHDEAFVDVTLSCEGRRIEAHKLVLSACSPYFKQLFKENPCKHPIMFLHNVEFRHLTAIVEFMYVGEVNVAQTHLPEFIRTAESLQIRGLADNHAKFMDGRSLSSMNNSWPLKRRDDSLSSMLDSSNPEDPDDFASTILPSKRKQSRSSIDHTHAHNMQGGKLRELTAGDLLDASTTSSLNPFLGLETTVEAVNAVGSVGGAGSSVTAAGTAGLTLQGALDAATAAVPSHAAAHEGDVVKPHSLDPRPCPECGRVYSNISNLRQHIRLIHYPECIACPLCFKPFKNKLYLKRHLISYHELLPPSYMEKRYNNNYNTPQSTNVGVAATSGSTGNHSAAVFTYKSQPPDGFLQRHASGGSSNGSESTNDHSHSAHTHALAHTHAHHPLNHHIHHHTPQSPHSLNNNMSRTDNLMSSFSTHTGNHMMPPPVQAVLSSPPPPQSFYTPNGAVDYAAMTNDNHVNPSTATPIPTTTSSNQSQPNSSAVVHSDHTNNVSSSSSNSSTSSCSSSSSSGNKRNYSAQSSVSAGSASVNAATQLDDGTSNGTDLNSNNSK